MNEYIYIDKEHKYPKIGDRFRYLEVGKQNNCK